MERENYANPRWELHVWKVSSSKQWARRPPAHRHTHAHAYTHAHAVSSHTVRPCWTLWQDRLLCHHDQLGTAMDCGPQDSHPNMQYARYSEQSSLATQHIGKGKRHLSDQLGTKRSLVGDGFPFDMPAFALPTLQGQLLNLPLNTSRQDSSLPKSHSVYCHNSQLTPVACWSRSVILYCY